MTELNEKELNFAREIVKSGLVKAAESLSFFMNEPIQLKETDGEGSLNEPPLELGKKNMSNIQFLITKVIGELKGVCCLIFSEEEANHLRSVALPPEILNSPEMMAEMSDGIMLEVDNIISASVITQFSNLLKVKIYGGVPELRKLTYEEMENYIQNEIAQELYLVSFKTSFHSSKIDFNPEFVWLFDNAFIESIRKHAESI